METFKEKPQVAQAGLMEVFLFLNTSLKSITGDKTILEKNHLKIYLKITN